MNGPLLVKNCEVIGFSRGVSAARSVNGQTFENISLRGQTQIGFTNEGQTISIRGFTSDNAVPALSTYGRLLLIDAKITGRDNVANAPAIVNFNGGRIFLRDVRTNGYKRALADMRTPDFAAAYRIVGEDKSGSLGPDISEYCSHETSMAFPSPANSLRLPVKETPQAEWEAPSKWAVVDTFGADPTGKTDSGGAIQKAIDSGATTVFLPGHYTSSKTILVRGKVRRVIGISGWMNYGKRDLVNFRVAEGQAPTVWIENFSGLHGGIEIATRRTVVLRSVGTFAIKSTDESEGGELFLEDVGGDDFRFHKQRVWAR